jgi:hypothetical protein
MSGTERSVQISAALQAANDTRVRTATIRARIAAAPRRESAYLAAEEVEAATMAITFYRLVCSVRRIGDLTARSMLGVSGVNGEERVDSWRVPSTARARLIGHLLTHAEGRDFDGYVRPPRGRR